MEFKRITVRGSAEFKSYLMLEASKEGMSVSELIRQRCERKPGDEEALLKDLLRELHLAVESAKKSVEEGVAAVNDTLREAKIFKAQQ